MKSTLLTCAILCGLSGCATSLLEERVITQFVDAFEEENVTAMRRVVSTEFEHKALRSEDVLRDLDIVELPKGEVEILEISDPTEDQRTVIVSDASGDKFKFDLVQDPQKQRWAVNDVLVSQQKRLKKSRLSGARRTTHLLDLVFTVREFMTTWSESRRTDILAQSSPALRASLQSVPDAWLPVITHQVAANYDPALARKPEAHLNADSAVVRMPIRGGHLLVKALLLEDRWLIDDIEIHSRSDSGHPGSVRRQADSVGSLGRFLTAFANGDRQLLQASSTPPFYSGTLQFADLSQVTLPSPDTTPNELSIRAFSGRVTIVVPTAREFIRFDLIDPDYKSEKHIARGDASRQFLVSDVKLSDRTRQSERTLASVFTAPARSSLFFEALQNRDVEMLGQLSTHEFKSTIWDQITDQTMQRLTIPVSRFAELTLVDTDVRGNRTELTFATADRGTVKCRMMERTGRLLVDDVSYTDDSAQMVSLRQQAAVQIPIVQFAEAWKTRDLDNLKHSCSAGLDRMVFSNFTTFPPDNVHLADRLDTAMRSAKVTNERATVHMGLASTDTAEVHLIQQQDRWVIDDISLPIGDQTVQIRKQLRQLVVNNMQHKSIDNGLKSVPTRVPQPVPSTPPSTGAESVIEPVSGTRAAAGPVVNVPYEVFGPGSADVFKRLEHQTTNSSAPEAGNDGVLPSASAALENPIPKLKPVPAPVPTSNDDFVVFGPPMTPKKQESARQVDSPQHSTPERRLPRDLSQNPVPID